MRNPSLVRPARGFSLIEVLIAVVILSVGLLALASLQVNLIRSSGDTKTRSVAMALAKQEMEQMFSFKTVGGAISCTDPLAGGSNTCYRAIDTNNALASVTVGGVTLTPAVTVTRYVYDISTGHIGFWDGTISGISNTALDATFLANPLSYVAGKEFKKVTVTVSWTDAEGNTATNGSKVQIEDVINAIEPSDSAAVSKANKGATPRKAQSIITNPASVAGVIPIAIGNGSDTAATNPRPIIVSQGNSGTAIETRFDVYTYAALNGTSALAQSRVETAVVGCTCTASSGTHSAARPTYWNGTQYTVPTTASGIPNSAPKSGNSVTQSDQCTVCCRDHFDPSGVAGEKFDPRRSTHSHYLDSNLTTAVTTGDYSEACRLIRVDGIFHVAAEPYDDHYGLLGTVGLMNSTATTTVVNAVPAIGSGSISELYQTFVLNYLKARFVNGTTYNTVTNPTSITGYSAIQVPALATINPSTSSQYMHARGLLIDYMSTEAIAAVDAAKADCAAQNVVLANSCPIATLQTNVLKLLPFTSINATELALWSTTPANSPNISVTHLQDFFEAIGQTLPVSGRADANTNTAGIAVTANTTIQGGSAGLALTGDVFPAAAYTGSAYSMSDTQAFQTGVAVVVGPYPGGEQFNLVLTGTDLLANVTIANPAQVYFESPTYKSCTPNASTMTPYICTTDTYFALGGSTPIKVGNYNRSANKTVQNSCTQPNPTSNSSDTTTMPYAIVFDVSSATVDGSPVTPFSVTNNDQPGISGEYTTMTANPVNVASTVTINFSNKAYRCPSNWTSFLDSTGDDGSVNPSNNSTLCTGNGNNKTPAWTTTTYVACWSGFAP